MIAPARNASPTKASLPPCSTAEGGRLIAPCHIPAFLLAGPPPCSLQEERAALQGEIAALQAELAAQQRGAAAAADAQRGACQELTAKCEQQAAVAASLGSRLQGLKAQLGDRDQRLTQLAAAVEERDASLAKLKRLMRDMDGLIAELKRTGAEQVGWRSGCGAGKFPGSEPRSCWSNVQLVRQQLGQGCAGAGASNVSTAQVEQARCHTKHLWSPAGLCLTEAAQHCSTAHPHFCRPRCAGGQP